MTTPDPATGRYLVDWTPVRHSATFRNHSVDFRICPGTKLGRATVAQALRDAVDRLRAVEAAFSRDVTEAELRAAITAAVMAGSRRVRDATGGYFDPWAMPGGFDPAGLLTGWALERAATALTDAGLTDFALSASDELLVRGTAEDGKPWRVGIRHPSGGISLAVTDTAISTSTGAVIDPHTQAPARHWDAVTVLGPDLGIADAYATALRAAGPAGLAWFPTADGYRTVLLTAPRPTDEPTLDLASAA